jgi:hypothetical protein
MFVGGNSRPACLLLPIISGGLPARRQGGNHLSIIRVVEYFVLGLINDYNDLTKKSSFRRTIGTALL